MLKVLLVAAKLSFGGETEWEREIGESENLRKSR